MYSAQHCASFPSECPKLPRIKSTSEVTPIYLILTLATVAGIVLFSGAYIPEVNSVLTLELRYPFQNRARATYQSPFHVHARM